MVDAEASVVVERLGGKAVVVFISNKAVDVLSVEVVV